MNAYLRAVFIFTKIVYSLLSDVTGFCCAARHACPATVINAITTANAPAEANTPTPKSTRNAKS